MGTTFCSIHIYSKEPVTLKDFSFQSFSQGWQTLLIEDDDFLASSECTAFSINKITDIKNAYTDRFKTDLCRLLSFWVGSVC